MSASLSTPRIWTLCLPKLRLLNVLGEVQGPKSPLSILHSNETAVGEVNWYLPLCCLVRFEDEADMEIRAGEVLIIPHGDAHIISNGAPATLMESGEAIDCFLKGRLSTVEVGGGGEQTRLICGYFGCARHADRRVRV